MNSEQRRALIRGCPEPLGRSRSPYTRIYHNGYVITVDYCQKHDTGSALVTGIRELSNLPPKGLPVDVSGGVDRIITDWANQTCEDMRMDLHIMEEALRCLGPTK